MKNVINTVFIDNLILILICFPCISLFTCLSDTKPPKSMPIGQQTFLILSHFTYILPGVHGNRLEKRQMLVCAYRCYINMQRKQLVLTKIPYWDKASNNILIILCVCVPNNLFVR